MKITSVRNTSDSHIDALSVTIRFTPNDFVQPAAINAILPQRISNLDELESQIVRLFSELR